MLNWRVGYGLRVHTACRSCRYQDSRIADLFEIIVVICFHRRWWANDTAAKPLLLNIAAACSLVFELGLRHVPLYTASNRNY